MSDLEQRVTALEAKVKILEETLETLKNMGVSEQMESFIKQKEQTLKMVSLINSVSEKPSFNFGKEEETVAQLSQTKQTIDEQIQAAIKDAGTFSDGLPGDPRLFNYEIETGMTTDTLLSNRQESDPALTKFAGKGLRITAYNGFETDRVVIPAEIDGQPVISIGEKVFKNATVSEVILPKSLKAILGEAFCGCSRLRHISIPSTTEYLGKSCFALSGLEELAFPAHITNVPVVCCSGCTQLKKVTFGTQVTAIDAGAFQECTKLREISLPNNLLDVEFKAFAEASIDMMIFPGSVKRVSKETFGDRFTLDKHDVVCVFLGKDTVVDVERFESFTCVSLIYCLPGSKIQQIAREHSIPMRPLSAFRMEN